MGGSGGTGGSPTIDEQPWSKRFPRVVGVAPASDGGLFVASHFHGTVDVGGGPVTSAGGADILITRLDQAGEHAWSKRFGGPYYDNVQAIAVDGADNVILSGTLSQPLSFGGGALVSAGSYDMYLAKLDAAGNHVWSKRFGDAGAQYGGSVAVDGPGNVVVLGYADTGAVDFGGGALTGGGKDILVAKLDAAGNHLWSKRLGGTGNRNPRRLALDGAGNVVLLGQLAYGNVNAGGGPLACTGFSYVFFLAKLDSAGDHVWSRCFDDTESAMQDGLAVDGAGNVVIAGAFDGTTDFGGGPVTSTAGANTFLAKYDAAGDLLWSDHYGDTAPDSNPRGAQIAVDSAGNVIATGEFTGSLSFGGAPLVSAGYEDIFIARFDPAGGHLSSERFGDALVQKSDVIAVSKQDSPIIAGHFSGVLDLGVGPVVSTPSMPGFLARLAP